jgi:hypothetical protein
MHNEPLFVAGAPMPFTTRHKRLDAIQVEKFGHYFRYAIGEIILIFAGITLALWFGNWNEERQLRWLEVLTLKEIVVDLNTNVEKIGETIERDSRYIEACEGFLKTASLREPWQDAYAKDLFQCQWWTSPFFSSAAYESLKSRGADLVSDPAVRSAIVDLYEQTYAELVDDTDKNFWSLQTSVLQPVFVRYLRYVEPDQLFPNNYEALLDSDEFINALHLKMLIQNYSVSDQQATLATTKDVIEIIEAALLRQAF